jgi:hypothetical protein
MSRPVRAALVAVVAVATFALAPAATAERATLKVTAHVVDRCTVAVPLWIASSEWQRWRHRPGHFLSHSCRGRAPFWVHMKKVLLRYRHGDLHAHGHSSGPPPGRQQRTPHPSRDDVVLVTITY